MANISNNKETKKESSLSLHISKEPDIVKCWANFLNQRDWQLWTTLTTGHELTLAGARRSINKLADTLKRHNYPSEIFWVAEPFDIKEGFHIHSLISFVNLNRDDDNSAAYQTLISQWRQITHDENARVFSERYKDEAHGGGANHYVGKYMMKYKCDYDFLAPHIKTDDTKFHNEETHPGISLKMNRKQFNEWKTKKLIDSKEFKKEVKNGEFMSRDNSIIFDRPKFNPGFRIKTQGQLFEYRVNYEKNVYNCPEITLEEYQHRNEKYISRTHKTGIYNGKKLR